MERFKVYTDTDTVYDFGTKETAARAFWQEKRGHNTGVLLLVCEIGSDLYVTADGVHAADEAHRYNESQFQELLKSL